MYQAGLRSRGKGKRPRLILVLLLAVVLASAAAYYAHVSYRSYRSVPPPLILVNDYTAPTKPTASESYRGLPVRLKIPSIGVDTSIEYVGDTPAGAMAAPSSPLVAGWYKYGAIPGEAGSSVIAGHVVGPLGEPGVFKRLSELADGNTIQVVDARGQTASFTVRSVRTYDETQQHAEVFNSASGTRLNLVTCAGAWDAGKREYAERLVVFTDQKI